MTSSKTSSRQRRRAKARTVSDPQDLVPKADISGVKAAFISESYNKVARAAKLEGLVLTGSNFIVHPDHFAPRDRGALLISYSYGANPSDFLFDDSGGFASCAWTWTMEGKLKDQLIIRLIATYRIFYSGLVGCEKDAVMRFMYRVGRFATYPYFRAHVSHASWESSTNLPLLPTISS